MASGTSILSGKYDFGMLVAADSWSYNIIDGKRCTTINSEGKEEDEVAKKIFHLGSYIIYAFSGHDYLGLHILNTLTQMMEDNHKKGRVLTSKECARYANTFLTLKRKRSSHKYSQPTPILDSLSCGVTVAMYAQHMQKRKLKLKKGNKSKKRKQEEEEEEEEEDEEDEEEEEEEVKLVKRNKSKKRQDQEAEDDEKALKLKEGKKLEKRKQEEEEEDEEDDDEKKLKRKKSKKREEGDDDEKDLKLKTGKKLEKRKQEEKKMKLRKGLEKKKEKQTQFNHELYFASEKFKANRKARLYYADEEQVLKITRFFADGSGDAQAEDYLHDVYDPSDTLNVAVTKMEDAMVTACAQGRSGGTITIDCIDWNNVITTVSQKDIYQLRRAKSTRDLVALSANRQRAPREDRPPYHPWTDCPPSGRGRPAV